MADVDQVVAAGDRDGESVGQPEPGQQAKRLVLVAVTRKLVAVVGVAVAEAEEPLRRIHLEETEAGQDQPTVEQVGRDQLDLPLRLAALCSDAETSSVRPKRSRS